MVVSYSSRAPWHWPPPRPPSCRSGRAPPTSRPWRRRHHARAGTTRAVPPAACFGGRAPPAAAGRPCRPLSTTVTHTSPLRRRSAPPTHLHSAVLARRRRPVTAGDCCASSSPEAGRNLEGGGWHVRGGGRAELAGLHGLAQALAGGDGAGAAVSAVWREGGGRGDPPRRRRRDGRCHRRGLSSTCPGRRGHAPAPLAIGRVRQLDGRPPRGGGWRCGGGGGGSNPPARRGRGRTLLVPFLRRPPHCFLTRV